MDDRNRRRDPPPPCDPFTRFSQPWPRSDQDDENPFIQFRRFADDAFNSFFSGIPRMFGIDDYRSARTPGMTIKERHRKQVEENNDRVLREFWARQSEENRQAMFNIVEQFDEEVRRFQEAKARSEITPPGSANHTAPALCPAMPAFYEKSQSEHTEAEPAHTGSAPWWTKGRASRCPALTEHLSESALKCPAMFDEAGNARTELDAYERVAADKDESEDSSKTWGIDMKPYGWSSGLGWDGKVKQSFAQARANSHQPGHLDCLQEDDSSVPDTSSVIRHRGHAESMNPFTQSANTLPWIILSPYSPLYLCSPDQPSVMAARFYQDENQACRVDVLHQQNRRPEWHDMNTRLARALPWADAFEDLMSLENKNTLVERNTSTVSIPEGWISDMVKRGSLGPTWGFNHVGLVSQGLAGVPLKPSLPKVVESEEDPSPTQVMDAVRGQIRDIMGSLVESVREQPATDVTKHTTVQEHKIEPVASNGDLTEDLSPEQLYDELRNEVLNILEDVRAQRAEEVEQEATRERKTGLVASDEELSDDLRNDPMYEVIRKEVFDILDNARAQAADQVKQAATQERKKREEVLTSSNNEEVDNVTTMHQAQVGSVGEQEAQRLIESPILQQTSKTWSGSQSLHLNESTEAPDDLVYESIQTRTETTAEGKTQRITVKTQRFADGRETETETTETMPTRSDTKASRTTHTATPVQDALRKQDKERKGGWFWS